MFGMFSGGLGRVSKNVRHYLLATALIGFALDGGVFSVLFNLYLLRLDFGPAFIGQVNSMGLLAFALSSFPAGALGTRLGTRRMMLLGLTMMAGSGLSVPLAPLFGPAMVAPLLVLGYVTMFMGVALYFVNSVPFVMDISEVGERSHAFSIQTALLALAAFCGALIGGNLPQLFAWLLGMPDDAAIAYGLGLGIAALLMTPSIWVIARLPQPNGQADEPDDEAPVPQVHRRWRWTSPVVITLFLLSTVRFFQVSGIATVFTFFNVYMDSALSVPTAIIGLVAALGRLLGVPAALLTPMLVARWGAPRTVMLASTVSTLGMVILATSHHWSGAGLGYIGVAAFASMRYPAFMLYSMTLVPPRWRGTLAGAGETAGGLSFAGMALVGGYLIGERGFLSLFLLGGALTLIGTVLFLFWFVLPQPKRATYQAG